MRMSPGYGPMDPSFALAHGADAKRIFQDPKLDGIKGVMKSSGEGKWTVETALEVQASAPVIAMSLFMRYRSLTKIRSTAKSLRVMNSAAMRLRSRNNVDSLL